MNLADSPVASAFLRFRADQYDELTDADAKTLRDTMDTVHLARTLRTVILYLGSIAGSVGVVLGGIGLFYSVRAAPKMLLN